MNSVAADVIASYSSSIRFPKYVYADNRSVLNALVPGNEFKFVTPSIVKNSNRRFNVGEVVNNLVKQKSMLCSYEVSSIYGFLGIFNVLDSSLEPGSILRAQRLSQQKINFLGLPYYTTAVTNRREVNVAYNNSTAIRSVLNKITGQFDVLKKRSAFLENYRRFEMDLEEMAVARESMQGVIEAYEKAETLK
ncbi:TBG [Enterospora canceri]|uniref:TBG n=1 Tax=Enterospora canceri TaxID=1081671 RepID=A0A1Y1S7Q6_9MICR|nr:TBG [Enterospora canceri]